MTQPSYKKAFYYALSLHAIIIALLLTDNSSKQATLTKEAITTPGISQPTPVTAEKEIVKAVSVDNKQVQETINKLKAEREQQKRAEQARQDNLRRQAEMAKQQRIKEQKEIARLKEEANRIAIEKKKQVEQEKKRLKELAEQQAKEAKRIEELKKQQQVMEKKQQEEAKKLAELNKKKELEKKAIEARKAAEQQAEKDRQAKAKALADAEKKRQAQEAAARQNAENQARIAGEVDKYKALIVNAIGRHWILPENADGNLSSQFRIRLAPDGSVMEVSLTRSSGDPLLDRSAQTAIYKASPLPVPKDSETFNLFRDISLTVRPEHVRG